MKTVAKLGKALGGFVLLLATMAFIAFASLFVIGSYLTLWPVLRLSPRGQRKQAIVNLLVSVMGIAQAFSPDDPDELLAALGANKSDPDA